MHAGDPDWNAPGRRGSSRSIRDRLRAGERTLGCGTVLGSPTAAELVASVGLDWLIIESDHYGVDAGDIQQMLMATARTGTAQLIRTPRQDLNAIAKALDVGAQGVVVPMVSDAEEASRVVRATRYPPDGTRSFGPMRASTYYLDAERYRRETAASLLVILILETRGAVDDLERLADVGVDGVIVGPSDLSLAYGLDPLKTNPEIEEIAQRALEIGRRTGLAIGINVTSTEDLARRYAQGFTLLDIGPELRFLQDGLRSQTDTYRALQAQTAA